MLAGILGRIAAVFAALYQSKDADRAVEESKSMRELVGRLIPVFVGLVITGAVVANAAQVGKVKGR